VDHIVHGNDVLSNQLLANANDPSWYLPFSDAVANLSEEDAIWKPNPDSHSIAEIVQHLLYWNETWQLRYKKLDVDAVPPIGDNSESFLIKENEMFFDIRDRLLEVLLEWQKLLSEVVVESDVKGFPVHAKWWEIIGNVTTHNAYHIGQIVYIRKLQSSL
jgi:uncharacterized damage-inducible protein DinB